MTGALAVAVLVIGPGFAADPPAKDTPEKSDKPRITARTGTITGKVTYDGKPVAVGIINIHPAKGIGVVAEIQKGKYTAEGVPPGPVIITVRTAEMRQLYTTLKKAREAGGVGEVITQPPSKGGQPVDVNKKLKETKKLPPLPGAKELAKKQEEAWANLKDMIDVPAKFADPKTSGLTFTIKPGAQEVDLNIPKTTQGQEKKSEDRPSKDKKSDN
jgi:hypothetical protein